MKKNKKYPLGGLLTAAQLVQPILQEKLEQITAAPVVPDMTYNSSPYGKLGKGGSIHINPENKGKFTETKRRTGKTTEELTHSKNPLTRKRAIFAQNAAKWKHEDGGMIPNEFTQYNAPDHDNGGMTVDANGKPSVSNAVAEVQNNENTFKNYVYSDELTNPKTGNKFNLDMKNLVKKYKGSDMDMIKKSGLNVEAETLAKTNDVVRNISESIDSVLPQAPNGIDLEPLPQLPINIVPGQVGPQAGNQNLPHISDSFDFGDGAFDISIPTVPDPWFGIIPQEPAPVPATPSYGTRPESIAAFVKAQLTPEKKYDDVAYDPTAISLRENPTDVGSSIQGGVFDDKFGIGDGATPDKKPFNYNIPALVAKGLGFAGSVVNALKPAQKEKLILPDYQAADQSFDRASIDYTSAKQDALGASNYLANINRGTSSGFSQYRNREQARVADLQDKLSDINMAERNANSQLDVTRGQYRAGKAQDIANRTLANQEANLQNLAIKQQFDDTLFSELTQIGSSLNQYQNFLTELQNKKDISKYTVNEIVALSKAKGYNFSFKDAEDFLNSIKSGNSPLVFNK